ncbi:MAG: hypothetical protein HY908_02295 [Myxococcales bacterium]|nr:hypothetical protein [Myxococcales bacterium]
MISLPSLDTLPAQVQRVVGPDANPKMQLVAARGILPGLRAGDIVTALCLLARSATAEVAGTAEKTLASLPDTLLLGATGTPDLASAAVDALARHYLHREDVIEPLLRQAALDVETVEHLAANGSEAVTQLVATNEERMLAHPHLIELLYTNRHTRMSTADRLVELAVRHDIQLHGIAAWKEIAQAIKGELIPEPSDEPLPEDEFFKETAALAEALVAADEEDVCREDEQGAETLLDRYEPLFKRLSEMTVSQRIRRAYLGTKEERLLLVRESNKMVATAAIRSPQMRESEVALIARNRAVCDDVLRIIGSAPEWLRSYQVKRNLVENPKTPVTISQKLISHLRETDLRRLARNKNISAAVQLAAKRQLERRT